MAGEGMGSLQEILGEAAKIKVRMRLLPNSANPTPQPKLSAMAMATVATVAPTSARHAPRQSAQLKARPGRQEFERAPDFFK